MKKVLTAMTAVSMTLQASDNLQKEIMFTDLDRNPVNSSEDLQGILGDDGYTTLKDNFETLGASGSFVFTNSVSVGLDTDNSSSVTAGDVLVYDVLATNNDQINASGAFIDDLIGANTSLVNGAVNTSHGAVVIGNNSGDENISIDINQLDVGDSALISFAVIVNPIPDGQIVEISNQALLSTINLGSLLSDDPNNYNGSADPTIIKGYGSPVGLYIESTSDDFTEHYQIPTPILLNTELDRVSGVVGGIGIDFEDCFQFDVAQSRVVDKIILESYSTSGGNFSTSFQVFTGLPPIKVAIGDIVSGEINENLVGSNLLYNFQNLAMGTFSVCLIESIPGQTYSLIIESTIEDNIFTSGFE